MADVMVKILMKGAKAIGKTAVILIIWTAHKARMEQVVSDSERGRYCGVRFRLPNVQKCRRRIFTV